MGHDGVAGVEGLAENVAGAVVPGGYPPRARSDAGPVSRLLVCSAELSVDQRLSVGAAEWPRAWGLDTVLRDGVRERLLEHGDIDLWVRKLTLRMKPLGSAVRRIVGSNLALGTSADGIEGVVLEVADDGTVRVVLQGACARCPAQSATLRFGLEAGLRSELPEVAGVVAIPARDSR